MKKLSQSLLANLVTNRRKEKHMTHWVPTTTWLDIRASF